MGKGVFGLVHVKNKCTVIYYAPVPKKIYFEQWEYYQVDLDMLESIFSKVIVCHNTWSFLKAIIFSRVSLVYCWWWHQSVLCIVISRLLSTPVYVTGAVHMYDESGAPDFFTKGILFRLACRISWRLASKNLFISKSQYRQICSHESVNNPSLLKSSLNESYDVSRCTSATQIKKNEVKIRMLTIVWMTKDQLKRKSVYETLDAISWLVKNGHTDFEWTVAGGANSGTDDLVKRIKQLNLEKYVVLHPDISNATKLSLYENADIYIQPSYYEGFGNAVLEAMSFGIVAIVSRNAAQAEVVGKTGFIVEEIDKKCIADAVIQYLQLSLDERIHLRKEVFRTVSERHLFKYRVDEFKKIISGENSFGQL